MQSFEIWFKNFQKKKSAAFILAPLSLLYSSGVFFRHRLYDKKWIKPRVSSACVVSVGNIVAGGAGKTQVVDLIVSELKESLRVAILSRGYRSLHEKKKKPLFVDPSSMSAEICGDEPWLLASRLKGAQVIVCKDRGLAAKEAEFFKHQLLVLDDGMQHRKLHRDFEIVVMDASNPFGMEKYLPWGMLRDVPKRLKSADVIVSIGKLSEPSRLRIEKLTEAPIVQAKIKVQAIKTLAGTDLESIKGKKVSIFCAIGNPQRFVQTVKELGADVILAKFFPDHAKISPYEVHALMKQSQKLGANLMLCTEKDMVKLKDVEKSMPIGWISVKLEIEENNAVWKDLLFKIKQLAEIAA